MTVRDLLGNRFTKIGYAKASINSAATVNFDFGDPNDLNLPALAGYKPGDRIVVHFTATTTGNTNTLLFVVQDAPDSTGSIGTPAAAVTDGIPAAAATDQNAIVGVRLQPGRPWLRCAVTANGNTDTWTCTAVVYAVPQAMV